MNPEQLFHMLAGICFSACWGSFLNVLGYRLVREESLFGRSHCTHCHASLAWHDLIPLFSWCWLGGACRSCKSPISWLYPAVELCTIASMLLLFIRLPLIYACTYFIFFSALIVTIRSDAETMLISRYTSIYLAPLGIFASFCGLLPIGPLDSIIGAICGYGSLYIIGALFAKIRGTTGIGQGDLELLCLIGAFTGTLGCWATVCIASFAGSLYGIIYLIATGTRHAQVKIPFGPFLALGAILFVLYGDRWMTIAATCL
ncbi:MAG TPA: prepilin peptidase [Candidatus Bathyarchaeia archaeon]|nr:prepilin peptidase [Candidatus Bathyarchaeia archaeon]